eukprot:CAMPEP_0181298744 /NCGR_PEP_ID=MMETSP1101-20121128/5950_1 /TAXON_ID=46948 /ORGANISM="Rhodomonas abbreviata, Strain Caron Lab Isolate" /LENGTH=220 /DNA_ID=CAMNT_0023403795 /DNA_START=1642 /DNA_END=2306 /DNA_ORIENTATION=+
MCIGLALAARRRPRVWGAHAAVGVPALKARAELKIRVLWASRTIADPVPVETYLTRAVAYRHAGHGRNRRLSAVAAVHRAHLSLERAAGARNARLVTRVRVGSRRFREIAVLHGRSVVHVVKQGPPEVAPVALAVGNFHASRGRNRVRGDERQAEELVWFRQGLNVFSAHATQVPLLDAGHPQCPALQMQLSIVVLPSGADEKLVHEMQLASVVWFVFGL